jgi:hypothetical protein
MKKAIGLIMLLLAALLVAMPVAADTLKMFDETNVSMFGTKTIIQEEVGGIVAENTAALAVIPDEAQTVIPTFVVLAGIGICVAHYMRSTANFGNYKPTPGAGGDGFHARFS